MALHYCLKTGEDDHYISTKHNKQSHQSVSKKKANMKEYKNGLCLDYNLVKTPGKNYTSGKQRHMSCAGQTIQPFSKLIANNCSTVKTILSLFLKERSKKGKIEKYICTHANVFEVTGKRGKLNVL